MRSEENGNFVWAAEAVCGDFQDSSPVDSADMKEPGTYVPFEDWEVPEHEPSPCEDPGD